jgi:hypothetical protein
MVSAFHFYVEDSAIKTWDFARIIHFIFATTTAC